jgi:hypothetical protein
MHLEIISHRSEAKVHFVKNCRSSKKSPRRILRGDTQDLHLSSKLTISRSFRNDLTLEEREREREREGEREGERERE